jgi:hypothetical protein
VLWIYQFSLNNSLNSNTVKRLRHAALWAELAFCGV